MVGGKEKGLTKRERERVSEWGVKKSKRRGGIQGVIGMRGMWQKSSFSFFQQKPDLYFTLDISEPRARSLKI